MTLFLRKTTLLLVTCVAFSAALSAQGLEYVKSHYTKYEFRIPMRDGVKLFNAVYVPKDTSQTYPILLTRTPYGVGPYGADNYPSNLGPAQVFGKEGYIFAYEDVRGRYKSEGEFVNMRPYIPNKKGPQDVDESSDAYDTIEWLVKNVPNNNGRVGVWGISYPGFYTAMAAIDAPPALKACSPQAPISDWFMGDDWHHNGALFLAHAFGFFARFGPPLPEPATIRRPPFDYGTPDGYRFFLRLGPLSNIGEKIFKGEVPYWNEMMQHPNYDAYWKARNILPHLKNIHPAVMTVGGWFDAEDLYGPLHIYRTIEKSTPRAANMLVMGPWSHGQWSRGTGESLGDIHFNSQTSKFFQESIEFPFFQFYLKDKGDPKLPEAYVFEVGTDQWRQYASWPPKNTAPKSLYFHANGVLSYDPPAEESGSAFDEYVSDPAKPVPFIGKIRTGMSVEYMLTDQRFAESRTDVLSYQTDELDRDVTLAGPLAATLHVSTSGTASDWIVKLIDVYPDNYPDPNPNPAGVRMGGYQQLVRGEPFRGRFRNSFEKPEPFVPDKMTKIEFVLPDVFHTFRSGHRIMVQIQSSWFPLVDLNPQKYVDIYTAKESDFQKATQRVYRSKAAASSLRINVLE